MVAGERDWLTCDLTERRGGWSCPSKWLPSRDRDRSTRTIPERTVWQRRDIPRGRETATFDLVKGIIVNVGLGLLLVACSSEAPVVTPTPPAPTVA